MENKSTNSNFIKNIDGAKVKKTWSIPGFLVFLVGAIIIGIAVGFGLSKTIGSGQTNKATGAGTKVGITDKKTFKDKAEGVLKEGGIDGEGNFHLERPGGESQNVYLTSTTVDLTPFIGKKVRVWGETFTGQKAGWLMDVGSVEIL